MDKCSKCGKTHGNMYMSSYGEFLKNNLKVECFDKIGEACSHLPLTCLIGSTFLTDSIDALVTI